MTLVLNKATTVLPVDDAARARHFYADTLGLPHRGVADDGSEMFGSEGGPMLQLMPVKDGKHSEHTTLSFEVSEIERTVQEMEAKGVGSRTTISRISRPRTTSAQRIPRSAPGSWTPSTTFSACTRASPRRLNTSSDRSPAPCRKLFRTLPHPVREGSVFGRRMRAEGSVFGRRK